MPTQKAAEEALEMLRNTAHDIEVLVAQDALKSHMLKHVEGLMVAGSSEPVTIRRETIRGTDRWREAAEEASIAAGALAGLKERRDTAKITISLYQSELRDRK